MTEQSFSPPARTLGVWSAALCALFSTTYVLGQLAEWLGWLGSAGGPHSVSTPLGIAVLLTPSLLLAFAYVVLTVSLHYCVEHRRRVFTHLASAFAAIYATLVGSVYYVQLTFVMPHLAAGSTERVEPFVFVPFDSFFYSLDLLGYSTMSISTLFLAGAFAAPPHERQRRAAFYALLANGCLLPFLALQIYWPVLIWGGALWAVTFPAATIALALLLRRMRAPAAGGATPFGAART